MGENPPGSPVTYEIVSVLRTVSYALDAYLEPPPHVTLCGRVPSLLQVPPIRQGCWALVPAQVCRTGGERSH